MLIASALKFSDNSRPGRKLDLSLTIGITGAHGYVGSRLCNTLTNSGHEVIRFVRLPREGERYFALGEAVSPEQLEDLDVLVHCAWDMRATSENSVRRINITGSRLLLDAARIGGVSRIVFISSMSAFEGCRSVYGVAKLEVEALVRKAGGISIRPGLIYGAEPGGITGSLARLARLTPVLPMIGFGRFRLHTCHEDDLAELVLITCMSSESRLPPLITAAETTNRRFRDIVTTLAGRNLLFVPVPWQLAWLGIRSLELLGLRLRLKSDSLIGLVYSDPQPDFAALERLGATFRSFAAPAVR